MKKYLLMLLSLLLVFCMAFSFTACLEEDYDDDSRGSKSDKNYDEDDDEDENKTPEELIIGTWEGKMNGSAILGSIFSSSGLDQYVDTELFVVIEFEFRKNGNYVMSVNKPETLEYIEEFFEDAIVGLEEYYEDNLEAERGMTFDEFMEEEYGSKEGWIETALEQMESIIVKTNDSGTWELEDNKLYLNSNKSDEDGYYTITISKNKLTWKDYNGNDANGIYPIYCTRVD